MPQLPSGRKIAIDATRLSERAELNAQNVQRYPIHRAKTVTDQQALALQVLFADSEITEAFAPERALLERAALNLTPAGSA